ncbi:TPA: transposase, partial [Escherichia coli]|nr:transposase [Escherichia coli]
VLWSAGYFASSCGGAPISVIRQYIEQQQTPGQVENRALYPRPEGRGFTAHRIRTHGIHQIFYHFSRHFWHQQSHRRLCFIIDRNAIAVIGDGHGIRCFAHDSFPVMNDFPLLRTFHQDFRSHEEVNVEISIVSHGFNVVPLFWREHRKLPRFDKDHLIRLCTVFISVAEIFDRPMHNGKAWVNPRARSFIKMTFEYSGRRSLFIPERR